MTVSSAENREGAPHVAVIGGGTGSFALLQGIKEFTPYVSAIVNMSDNGGSTGVLMDELGVLPPGDIRQCLTALSDNPKARKILSHRFSEGPFKGHSLGNLILAGSEDINGGDFDQAVTDLSVLFDIRGEVIPVTTTRHQLIMRDGDEVIVGESTIAERVITSDEPEVYLDPPAQASERALQVIDSADMVVIAPGNFYSSLLPSLAVSGIAEALKTTQAHRVMVANLVTKPGQTDGWHVVDYVKQFERHLRRNGRRVIDTVLFNTEEPDTELLQTYAQEGELPVRAESGRFMEVEAECIGLNLLSSEIGSQVRNDLLRRSLIRHNGRAVGKALMRLYYS